MRTYGPRRRVVVPWINMYVGGCSRETRVCSGKCNSMGIRLCAMNGHIDAMLKSNEHGQCLLLMSVHLGAVLNPPLKPTIA